MAKKSNKLVSLIKELVRQEVKKRTNRDIY